MSAPSLQIVQPKHGAALTGAAPVPLVGSLSGDPAGLFFKWFSSLNAAASKDHPELRQVITEMTFDKFDAVLKQTRDRLLPFFDDANIRKAMIEMGSPATKEIAAKAIDDQLDKMRERFKSWQANRLKALTAAGE